ncbi:MAG: hypothetical protein EBS62_08330 [Betaproteobacteria bacterium]|nr:hypothetical protein [Betaproteobacteria bacterium]
MLEAQSAGASANQASTAQSASGAVKAPSSDMSVEDMIKALSGGTSQPGSPSTVTNAQSLNKASPGGPNSPAAATGSIQENKTYNDQLSARRAQSVVDFLVTQGVSVNRLRSTGKGFAELLYPQDPKAAANRRVRIKVGV